jgi:outer membrane protein
VTLYPVGRGNLLIGGNATLTSSKVEDSDRVTILAVSPSVGYFVADGLLVGGSVSLAHVLNDGGGTSFSIGPEVGYFFGGPGARVLPFVQTGVSYATGEGGFSSLAADVSAGAVFMVARNVGLSAEAFGLFFSADGGDDPISGNTFGLRSGIVAFLY